MKRVAVVFADPETGHTLKVAEREVPLSEISETLGWAARIADTLNAGIEVRTLWAS